MLIGRQPVSLAVSLAGVVSALLLLVPRTGSLRPAADNPAAARRGRGLEAVTALAAVAAGVSIGLFGLSAAPGDPSRGPASAASGGGQAALRSPIRRVPGWAR